MGERGRGEGRGEKGRRHREGVWVCVGVEGKRRRRGTEEDVRVA